MSVPLLFAAILEISSFSFLFFFEKSSHFCICILDFEHALYKCITDINIALREYMASVLLEPVQFFLCCAFNCVVELFSLLYLVMLQISGVI
jgi:hypothetical protein